MLARALHAASPMRAMRHACRLWAAASHHRGVAHDTSRGAWLEVDATAALDADFIALRLGVSTDTLDSIGDVRRVTWQACPAEGSAATAASDSPALTPIAELHWEGFMRTASDELYHATWANATGVHRVLLPLPARLLEVNRALSPAALDERTWLAKLFVRRTVWDAWQRAAAAATQQQHVTAQA